jgi:hypothetical protein
VKGVIANPDYWRSLAGKARRQAAALADARGRQLLLQIADSYDLLAEEAAQHARRHKMIDGSE